MAKKISWTPRAQLDRLEILEYWANRNKSKLYSRKLYKSFEANIKLVANNPKLGKPTKFESVRVIVVGDYDIYYYLTENQIEIAAIWDTRRNPAKLKL
jgi:plasmid stabilization system protein ParE